jgi:Arc/MetJ-type ribon-helix-helix transcriptional regulator
LNRRHAEGSARGGGWGFRKTECKYWEYDYDVQSCRKVAFMLSLRQQEFEDCGMNYSLPADIEQRIDARLASGAFASKEDVLREAMEGLVRRQQGLSQQKQLVAVAEKDVAAGRVGVFDRETIKRDVRTRLAERGIGE